MKDKIYIKTMWETTVFNNNKERTISAFIEPYKVYEAILHTETEEYFAKDLKGREFLVGEIDLSGNLVLINDFKLVE